MSIDVDIAQLLNRGGLYKNIAGSTTEELFDSVSKTISLPKELDPKKFFEALCLREKISTTAVGNGIAIPHSRIPILKDNDEQRISICYLKEPVDMGAADKRKVFVMLVVLTSNMQTHMKVISKIAELLKNSEIRKALEAHVELEDLLRLI